MASWLWSARAWADGAPLPVSFDASGQALPQGDIRVAIGAELAREARADDGAGDEDRERVTVAVDELGQLWVRYWGPRGLVDRHLTMPARPDQVPLVVSLSVGNLVRQEAFELLRELERRRAQTAAVLAPPPSESRKTPSGTPPATVAKARLVRRAGRSRAPALAAPQPKNSWGHYLVGDFAYFPTTARVCAVGSRVSCYDRDFAPITYEANGSGVAGGIVATDARYVMAYSRKLSPKLWAAARLGFAFSGGKGKRAAAKRDPVTPNFVPWLVELRVQYVVGQGALNGSLLPFVHVAGGFAEESAEVKVSAPLGDDGMPLAEVSDRGPITAIRSGGLLFAGGGCGLSLKLFGHVRAEAELSGFVAFPSYGSYIRPSVGLTYDF